uniref:Envelope membrane protein n=1 Tax=Glaukea argentea TaxID=2894057 RepID=A0A386B1I7_9CHLO|nr:Envelope membrane protein [Udotea argentea]AYC65562.1 Envelope membrane protein [Udotea argentea]
MQNFEQIGFLPRSIVRTFQRFLKQIELQSNLFALYEFRVSRYIAVSSLQCFCFLIICPWIFYFLLKFFLRDIFIDSPILFLNSTQQEQAFAKIQIFSQQLYFEKLFQSSRIISPIDLIINNNIEIHLWWRWVKFDFIKKNNLKKIYQNYFFKCTCFYQKQSIAILINWILDFITFLFFGVFFVFLTPQILILKTFFIELLINLSETTKCFFLIFFLDLLIGFHSSKSWEIFLQFLFEHFGFQIYQNFIAFFISIFPVFLDTIFKYWIFRYLNKISPSTVTIYQAMIE